MLLRSIGASKFPLGECPSAADMSRVTSMDGWAQILNSSISCGIVLYLAPTYNIKQKTLPTTSSLHFVSSVPAKSFHVCVAIKSMLTHRVISQSFYLSSNLGIAFMNQPRD